MERHFLGWDRPALPPAVDLLSERFLSGATLDLGGVLVVVPGARGGRRLLELLVERAEETQKELVPPRIITQGALPEELYEPEKPAAGEILENLVWTDVLRRSPSEDVERILRQPPDAGDFRGWLALGERLARLHRELAGEGLLMADVATRGRDIEEFPEEERWLALGRLQEAYLASLEQLGCADRQRARIDALRHGRSRSSGAIFLLGTVDLNRIARGMLDAVGSSVTVLVFAPESLADRFDELGCVVPAAWNAVAVDIDPARVALVQRPDEQAAAAVRSLAAYHGAYAAEDITIGAADETLLPYLEQHLERGGLSSHRAAGLPLARTPVHRLLEATGGYLVRRGYRQLAALLRHPDVESWALRRGAEPARSRREEWLVELDRYARDHLQETVSSAAPGKHPRGLRELLRRIGGLLSRLEGEARPIPEWAAPIAGFLVEIYGDEALERSRPADRRLLDTFDRVRAVLEELRGLDHRASPEVTAADALHLVLGRLSALRVPTPPTGEAIELLGWLELLLDDAPALTVCGFNDGFVPSSRSADPFLPNALCRHLGLLDNDRRLARDAYALSAISASRRDLDLILGRVNAEGEPLVPSRLLFACERDELPARVDRFFGEPDGASWRTAALAPGRREHAFEIPRPRPLEEPRRSMSITSFRNYLSCPYGFYLRHVLGLTPLDDRGEELDPLAFGHLAHEVLRAFGEGFLRASTDADIIARHLDDLLDGLVLRSYGREPRPAVLVQVEQLRRRLQGFARWQAEWAAEGWRIEHVEIDVDDDAGAALEVDGEGMRLRGRIDRIDRHEETNTWAVFDYKTSERGDTPEKTHRRRDGEWVDLQLPLYRHLVRAVGIPGDPRLGYIVLPGDADRVRQHFASWGKEELAGADDKARWVIRQVRRQVFWPPIRPVPRVFEDYRWIYQQGSPVAALAESTEGGE
ncbi:MAG: PD-(D/E)XK nuclease family protein [Planctomycetota bacterium]|nr:PD-(D/E)XK nuclease family protein [Planctomycetota bacterium]